MCEQDEPIRHTTPESVGIRSENIDKYIRLLEEKHLATHSLILARGNQVFFEHYWEPFHANFLHRMYSVSKSFVSLAIGFLEQDGLIRLDDRMSQYFAQELEHQPDQNMHNQTIRHMLMMSTAKRCQNWLAAQTDDRVRFYFENSLKETRPSGTLFDYDSTGSFVLCALAERVTGKPFMDYLREKMLDKIGVSKEAHCLKCPGGHSWGDSAVLCRPMDLFRVARFTLNGGSWNGQQLLNQAYLQAATRKQIDNNYQEVCARDTRGYGYQFWMTYQNSYYFNGMGCQFAVCVPDQDIIMVYNADNQGKNDVNSVIIDSFFELIVNQAEEAALPEQASAKVRLDEYVKGLKLLTAQGAAYSAFAPAIDGAVYRMNENPMGISQLRLDFKGDKGCLSFTNEQGDKTLWFGLGHNEFGRFPQEGYSTEVGSVFESSHYYQCAASAGWVEEHKLRIMVQIIDRYLGNMSITLGFQGDEVGVCMAKNAEFFLNEYQGFGHGKKEI